MMKSITWQQVVLILGLISMPILAFKFAGPALAVVGLCVTTVIAFLTRPDVPRKDPGPSLEEMAQDLPPSPRSTPTLRIVKRDEDLN